MRIIGLIGGMSWESSTEYYRRINTLTRAALGPLASARSLMYTVDFREVEALQRADRWDEAAALLTDAGQRLERGGAACIVLCTNTMHKVAASLEAAVEIPLLHIADCTAERIKAAGIERVGFLGTAFTMEEPFYRGRLSERFGLDVLTPENADRALVHRIIYDELCQGKVEASSRAEYARIMRDLAARSAQGIILGCTEITLLVGQAESPVPVFDTTQIHAEAAVAFAMEPAHVH